MYRCIHCVAISLVLKIPSECILDTAAKKHLITLLHTTNAVLAWSSSPLGAETLASAYLCFPGSPPSRPRSEALSSSCDPTALLSKAAPTLSPSANLTHIWLQAECRLASYVCCLHLHKFGPEFNTLFNLRVCLLAVHMHYIKNLLLPKKKKKVWLFETFPSPQDERTD